MASSSPPVVAEDISEQNGMENGLQMMRKWRDGTSLIDLPDELRSPRVAGVFQLAADLFCI